MAKADYYKTLGVERQADAAALKSAYRTLAKKYHPDLNQGDAAAEKKFKEVSEAYDILKEPQSRAAYDRYGHAAFENGGRGAGGGGGGGAGRGRRQQQGFGDINDIFEEFFGGQRASGMGGQRGAGRGGRRRPQNMRGNDLQAEIDISLEDAYHATTREVAIDSAVPCERCRGTGGKDGAAPINCGTCGGAGAVRTQRGFMVMEQICPHCQGQGQMISDPCSDCGGQGRVASQRSLTVKIPAGVDTGTRIRLAGEGEAGLRGGAAGDFYVFVNVRPHPFLKRDGANLFCEMPVPFTLAAAGGQVDVPLLDGKRVKLTIPAGAQPEHQLRLRGKGMPILQRSTYGDLYVIVKTEVPENLNEAQKELVKQLEAQLTPDNYPKTQAFNIRTKGKGKKS